jgi:ABC-type polysaccharide/polyol phosphate transport system ATPase subunit
VDKSFHDRVENALTRFPSGKQIVLHASHDHELMIQTCPKAVYVDDCGIRAFGPTAEVIEMYRNA